MEKSRNILTNYYRYIPYFPFDMGFLFPILFWQIMLQYLLSWGQVKFIRSMVNKIQVKQK